MYCSALLSIALHYTELCQYLYTAKHFTIMYIITNIVCTAKSGLCIKQSSYVSCLNTACHFYIQLLSTNTCFSPPKSTVEGFTALYRSVQHCSVLMYNTVHSCTVLNRVYRAVHLYTELYLIVQSCTRLNRAVQKYTGVYEAVQK